MVCVLFDCKKCNVASLKCVNPGKLLTPILQIIQQEAAFHRSFDEQARAEHKENQAQPE
jgi:hypothetical protein